MIPHPELTLWSISYATTEPSSSISRHTKSKVARIVGGTVGGVVGLVLIIAILFLLCRRRRLPSRDGAEDSEMDEKLEKEHTTPASSESQVATGGSNDPGRKLESTLPTTAIREGSGLRGMLSSSAPVQAASASDTSPKIPPSSTSSSDLQQEQHVVSPAETPAPFLTNGPSDDGAKELAFSSFAVESSPTGGEGPFPSRSSPATEREIVITSPSEAMEILDMPLDLNGDVELPLTYAMEIDPDTALIPTTTVEKLNNWTETSKVVFSIDIGTSHSVRFLFA